MKRIVIYEENEDGTARNLILELKVSGTVEIIHPSGIPTETETHPPSRREYGMRDAFDLWCHRKENTIKSYKDERNRLEKYVMTPLGHLTLSEITAPLVIQTVSDLDRSGKRATLKRVLMRLREMLDLSVCAGYIAANPLPNISKVFESPKTDHMAAPDWRELPKIIRKVIASAPIQTRDLFLLQLATMCRPNEIANMEKVWIGRDAITIPTENMKMKRIHRIPITPLMRRIIERCEKRHPDSPYLFTGRNESKPISSQVLAKWLHDRDEFRGRLVAHGLRSMARSWMADKGVDFETAERCLAHVTGNSVHKAYQRSDLFSRRKKVMTEWCAYLEKFIAKYEKKYDRELSVNGTSGTEALEPKESE